MNDVSLADFVVTRLRTPPPTPRVIVPGSTPVLSFGDPDVAKVATLGLNPSRNEFLNGQGHELSGAERRFETLSSLGVDSLQNAPDHVLCKVYRACTTYFARNPYRRWFDQLEPILGSVGVSYYDGSACHLDLVQWATDPVWGQIADRETKRRMIEADSAFLHSQIDYASFSLLLINGSGVAKQFEKSTGVTLKSVGEVHGLSTKATLSVGSLGSGIQVVAWSVNVQSSFGVCSELRRAIAQHVSELSRGANSRTEGDSAHAAGTQTSSF